jgi:hypothetical protein
LDTNPKAQTSQAFLRQAQQIFQIDQPDVSRSAPKGRHGDSHQRSKRTPAEAFASPVSSMAIVPFEGRWQYRSISYTSISRTEHFLKSTHVRINELYRNYLTAIAVTGKRRQFPDSSRQVDRLT